MAVGAMETHLREVQVELVSTVNRHEIFVEVAVRNDQASGEHDLGHVLEVMHGDEILEVIGFTKRDGDGEHHGKARVNRAGDEVGWENCSVPARNYCDSEVEAHHRVHGENEGRRQSSEKQIRGLVAVPMARGTAPAHS